MACGTTESAGEAIASGAVGATGRVRSVVADANGKGGVVAEADDEPESVAVPRVAPGSAAMLAPLSATRHEVRRTRGVAGAQDTTRLDATLHPTGRSQGTPLPPVLP